ncbi:MAG TPA: hypothetical protein VLZ54_08985 [Arenibacter sp.]|nr:hypothetical protein [Arenibacter sp.]
MKNLKKLLTRAFSLLFIALFLLGCDNDDDGNINAQSYANSFSVLVNANGDVLVSGFAQKNGELGNIFWANGEKVDSTVFNRLVDRGMTYREAIDAKYRKVYAHKDLNGQSQKYQFDQGSLLEEGALFYYRNANMIKVDSDSLGIVSAIAFSGNKSGFAGSYVEIEPTIGGRALFPTMAFFWDGADSFTELPLPLDTFNFQGVSSVYIQDRDEFYVGGLCGFPMYWKNDEAIILDSRYGEVHQITKSGQDVYVVGFFNKYNSNSTGHTAAYWKNGELVELEDNAQAYGIYIDGDDVYVSGSVGRVPVDYKPCYWKNGVRVDLIF